MKILLINHEFPPVGGGGATACEYIVKYLTKTNERVEVLTSGFNALPKLEKIDNCVIRRIPSNRKKIYSGRIIEIILFVINGIKLLKKEIKEIKPDITYAFFTMPAGFIALYLKKKYNIRYYVFLRGIDLPGFYGGEFSFLNKMFSPIIKYIWINADKIIANSQSLKELAFRTFNKKPIEIIPNGVDVNSFCPLEKAKRSNVIKILFVGRLNKQKGIDCLLKSIAKINKEDRYPFVLEIVGDGSEKERLINKSYVLGVSDRVIFSNWIDRSRIVDKYQSSDIFITTSLDEGMPNTLLEAMACGLPVIASDIPAHRELITHNKNGLLVPVNNPDKVADTIKLLIENESLRIKMRQEGLKKIKDYSWQNIFARLDKLNA